MIAVSARIVSWAGKRLPLLRLLTWSTVVYACGYLALSALPLVPGDVTLLLAVLAVALVLTSVANGVSRSSCNNIMLSFAPPDSSGRHASIMQSGWVAAGVVGPGMYALLFTWGWILPWLVGAVMLLAAAALFTVVRHRHHRP